MWLDWAIDCWVATPRSLTLSLLCEWVNASGAQMRRLSSRWRTLINSKLKSEKRRTASTWRRHKRINENWKKKVIHVRSIFSSSIIIIVVVVFCFYECFTYNYTHLHAHKTGGPPFRSHAISPPQRDLHLPINPSPVSTGPTDALSSRRASTTHIS